MTTDILLKRAYEPPSSDDGSRILIDRLWPRGVSKTDAHFDEWLKSIAPTDGLRHWFAHDPQRWEEFKKRYRAELSEHPDDVERLAERARQGRLTLVYAARDSEHNNALVVRDVIEEALSAHR